MCWKEQKSSENLGVCVISYIQHLIPGTDSHSLLVSLLERQDFE